MEISAQVKVFSVILQVSAALILLLAAIESQAQSSVPIDSPRGSYEGAENIHWYQQDELRAADTAGLPAPSGGHFQCNTSDMSRDCFGNEIKSPQAMYYAQGEVPIRVAVFVDSRITGGFDYPFRRGIDVVRRTNDAFARSGITARLYITEVRPFDFSSAGYSFVGREIHSQVRAEEGQLIASTLLSDQADVVVFVRNAEDVGLGAECGWADVGLPDLSASSVPLIVLTCEDSGSRQTRIDAVTAAPHYFGHVLGLSHQQGSQNSLPFLPSGVPFIDTASSAGTIMTAPGTPGITEIVPFFSSPALLFQPSTMTEQKLFGASEANAVSAASSAVTNVALYWELVHGSLSNVSIDDESNEAPEEPSFFQAGTRFTYEVTKEVDDPYSLPQPGSCYLGCDSGTSTVVVDLIETSEEYEGSPILQFRYRFDDRINLIELYVDSKGTLRQVRDWDNERYLYDINDEGVGIPGVPLVPGESDASATGAIDWWHAPLNGTSPTRSQTGTLTYAGVSTFQVPGLGDPVTVRVYDLGSQTEWLETDTELPAGSIEYINQRVAWSDSYGLVYVEREETAYERTITGTFLNPTVTTEVWEMTQPPER